MLLRFRVKNFKSIKEDQILDMSSVTAYSEHKDGLIQATQYEKPLSPVTAIYGANASGKSNFITAMGLMRRLILKSATKITSGDALDIDGFRMDPETRNEPSEFDIEFVIDEVKYQYGFAATNERIVEEWLYATPKRKTITWFERRFNTETQLDEYDFESALAINEETQKNWQSETRPNGLFFSIAALRNHPEISKLHLWFQHQFFITGDDIPGGLGFTAEKCKDKQNRELILSLIKAADVGIEEITFKEVPFEMKYLPKEMPASLKKEIAGELVDGKMLKVTTHRKDTSGESVNFDLEEESAGTQKILNIAGPILESLIKGDTLVFDELSNSIHPKLMRYIINLYQNPATNPGRGQIIFATHDVASFNQDDLRRDQIWLVQKNEHASHLYSLAEFKIRKDLKNLEKPYLSGAFGGVPAIHNFFAERI